MTSKAEQLKNQMAATANQITKVDPKTLKPKEKVEHYLNEMMPHITQVLPKHVDHDRMMRIALNVIRTNPKLLECNIESLMGGVMEAAKLGLEPGLLGQCYLIPFNKTENQGGKWVTVDVEAQFIIGYKGLIDLVRRSGQVSILEARVVYENDEFDYAYGLEDYLKHKPTLTKRGKPIAYYAVCKLKDGGSSFLVMGQEEMENYRDQYAKSKNYKTKEVTGPWKNEFEAMAKKTVLRQLIKYLPISVEHLSNLHFDERSGKDIHEQVANNAMVDGGYIPEIKPYDGQTGEIVGEQ